MSNQVAKLPRWNREQIELLKRTVAKGATDDEISLFTYVCKRTGLDPFLRQIHAVKRWSTDQGCYIMAFQTGIDGYRLQAQRTGEYAGQDSPEFQVDDNGFPIKASVTVYRMVNGERVGYPGEARYLEYVQRTKEGEPTATWKKMPFVMLSKCAEASALRKGFPAETMGLYVHEELPSVDVAPEGAIESTTGTLYEGTVTTFKPKDTKSKAPGQIAIALTAGGTLGPIGFWETPAALKGVKEVVGLQVQLSYQEKAGKGGKMYKNLEHLAVKAIEAAPEEEEGHGPGDLILHEMILHEISKAESVADLEALWGKQVTHIMQFPQDDQETLRMAYLTRKGEIVKPKGKQGELV